MLEGLQHSHCISTIKHKLDEVKASTINACWQNLWPQAVNNFRGFPSTEKRWKIAGLARKMGGEDFGQMELEELEELVMIENDNNINMNQFGIID